MDSPGSDGSDVQTSPTNDDSKDLEILRLGKLLEESKQVAYELRSRLQIAERCAGDYEAELENLQQDIQEKERLYEAAILEIQEGKSSAVIEAEEKLEELEIENEKLSNKITDLEKQLETRTLKSEIIDLQRNEKDALHQELKEALDALTLSTAACDQHKELISVLQNEKQVLAERVKYLENDLELYKEYLSVSKAQLSGQAEQFKEMQEQLAVTQSELTALRAAPNVQSRGNSLFAEVEDNRQLMIKQFKTMRANFNIMKKDYSSKCSQIAKLQKEKKLLLDKLQAAEGVAKKHYTAFVESYEIRIKELQMAVKDLKNDVKPVFVNGNPEILKYAEQTVLNSRREIKNLRDEMELRSALRLNEAAELLKTQGELAEALSELRRCKLKVKEMTGILNDHGISRNFAAVPEISSERDPPKTGSFKNSNIEKFRKTNAVELHDELLHSKFNPTKQSNVEVAASNAKKMEEFDSEGVKVEIEEAKILRTGDIASQNELDNSGIETAQNRDIILYNKEDAAQGGSELSDSNVQRSGNAVVKNKITGMTNLNNLLSLADELGFQKSDMELDDSTEQIWGQNTSSQKNCVEDSCEKSLMQDPKEEKIDEIRSYFDDILNICSAALAPSSPNPNVKSETDKVVRTLKSPGSIGSSSSSNEKEIIASPKCSDSNLTVSSHEKYVDDEKELNTGRTFEMEPERSILKSRTNFSAFGAVVESVSKQVRFEGTENNENTISEEEVVTDNLTRNDQKVEENKENASGVSEEKNVEGKKPSRKLRRPQPKQSQSVIFLSS